MLELLEVSSLSDGGAFRLVLTVKANWRMSASMFVLCLLTAGAAEIPAMANATVERVEKRILNVFEGMRFVKGS